MEVHLTPEQEAQLSQLATDNGRDVETLAQEILSQFLEDEARFIKAVDLGEAELDRGEYLTHEEVGARIERLFQS